MPGTPGPTADCPCCTVPCTSNPTPIPKTIPGTANYASNPSVDISILWNETNSQWEKTGGDTLLCPTGNLYLRDLVMQCTGTPGSFYFEMAIFTTQQEDIGNTQIFRGLGSTNPFTMFLTSPALTGFGISGAGCPDGGFINITLQARLV